MKNSILSVLAIAAMVFTSCSEDDGPVKSAYSRKPGTEISGFIENNTSVTLDGTYDLDGALVVEEGGSLTIEAGTKIEASGGTSSLHIAVARGAKIYVNGTAQNPVVMTSANTSAVKGDWGGLVVCGACSSKHIILFLRLLNCLTVVLMLLTTLDLSKYLRIEYSGSFTTRKNNSMGLHSLV